MQSPSPPPPPSSPPIKQSFLQGLTHINDGNFVSAAQTLTPLRNIAATTATYQHRLLFYMFSALDSCIDPTTNPQPLSQLYTTRHLLWMRKLYQVAPCFNLAFMAANFMILDATLSRGSTQIHVVDFDIGHHCVHLIKTLATRNSRENRNVALKVTAIPDFSSFTEEQVKKFGKCMQSDANRVGVSFQFSIKRSKIQDLNRQTLGIDPNEVLAVNLPFNLQELPDASVVSEDLRGQLIRGVKGLSPVVVTVLEENLNSNTSPLIIRAREAFEHYLPLFELLELRFLKDSSDRDSMESALGRRLGNLMAREGEDRVVRCETLGELCSRMEEAGFELVPMTESVVAFVGDKLNSDNQQFNIDNLSGSIGFRWKERILTVVSAWR